MRHERTPRISSYRVNALINIAIYLCRLAGLKNHINPLVYSFLTTFSVETPRSDRHTVPPMGLRPLLQDIHTSVMATGPLQAYETYAENPNLNELVVGRFVVPMYDPLSNKWGIILTPKGIAFISATDRINHN